jgi:hypothetical protein
MRSPLFLSASRTLLPHKPSPGDLGRPPRGGRPLLWSRGSLSPGGRREYVPGVRFGGLLCRAGDPRADRHVRRLPPSHDPGRRAASSRDGRGRSRRADSHGGGCRPRGRGSRMRGVRLRAHRFRPRGRDARSELRRVRDHDHFRPRRERSASRASRPNGSVRAASRPGGLGWCRDVERAALPAVWSAAQVHHRRRGRAHRRVHLVRQPVHPPTPT